MKLDRLLTLTPLLLKDQIRFWLKVDRQGVDDCWKWTSFISSNHQYGSFGQDGNTYIPSRISYFLHSGKDPGPMLVCHTCNNPICVNPKHLFLGSNSENSQQKFDEGRASNIGELNPRSTFRESDILDIRALAETLSVPQIAKIYGSNYHTIWDIIHQRSWRHVK